MPYSRLFGLLDEDYPLEARDALRAARETEERLEAINQRTQARREELKREAAAFRKHEELAALLDKGFCC